MFSAVVAGRARLPELWAWALVVWVSTLTAAGFSIWNWRLLWKAEEKSASEYIQACEHYCIAGLRHIRFGYRLLAVQLVIIVPWFSWKFFRAGMSLLTYALSMGLVAALTAV